MKRAFAFVLLAAGFAAWPGRALVFIGGEQPANLQPPPNGAPWDHIAEFIGGGTGVYLSKRFIITANHVNKPSSVNINGVNYALDNTWTSGGQMQIGGDDIKLIRIATDPGLAKLPLISGINNDLGKACTIIANGVSNGPAVVGGWQWGQVGKQRWGTNITLPTLGATGEFRRLVTTFDFAYGGKETCIANGDSGGALFQRFDGIWKLAGICVDTETGGSSLYDRDPAKSGNQPDHCYYVRVRKYTPAIRKIIESAAP